MEGPSIHLAAEQLQPFLGRRIRAVSGNSTIGMDRLHRQRLADIFAWGKHLVFQFDTFALRVHFLLWGTFAATVTGRSVTGDYRRSGPPRLVLEFPNGEITIWSASLRYVDHPNAREEYDFTTDVLSERWNAAAALEKARLCRRSEIADVLLDQAIFAGVGNIIKNEVLYRTRTSPFAKVGRLGAARLAAIVADARAFSFRFLELRRKFALRRHLEIYGRSVCPSCGGPVSRAVHGQRARRSFFCVRCQRVRRPASSAAASGRSRSRRVRSRRPGSSRRTRS